MNMEKHINSLVKKTLKTAERIYNQSFKIIDIKHNIKGKIAGQFCFRANGLKYFRFNPVLARENADIFDDTVIHEVSHYVARQLYGKIKPHGVEWKSVMVSFGVSPKTTHTMNCDSVKGKVFKYKCGCDTHELTIIRHNKVKRGKRIYSCKKCGNRLIYVG